MSGAEAWTSTVADLWPGARVGLNTGSSDSDRQYAFVPNASRPRLLVPVGHPGAAGSALRRYSHDLGVRQRGVRAMTALAMRTGLPEKALRDRIQVTPDGGESIEDRLGELLGAQVVVSISLGTARANRKPILHVLATSGKPLAFVKVGDNPLIRTLIRTEAEALRSLAVAPLALSTIPEVLFHGSWAGLDLLVLSPLKTRAYGWRPRRSIPVAAMLELARATGTALHPVRESDHWAGLRHSAGEVRDEQRRTRLCAVVEWLGARYGGVSLEFGAWHGDWTPWNMEWRRGGVQLWDWERFERGVPLGFDLLHYQLQDAMHRAGRNGYAELPQAADLLRALPLDRAAASATVDLYLLALCIRYQRAADGPRGDAVAADAERMLVLLEGRES